MGGWPELILVTNATTGGSVLFQEGVLFSTENAKFWPILAILPQLYAVFGILIKGLNNAVVYQK